MNKKRNKKKLGEKVILSTQFSLRFNYLFIKPNYAAAASAAAKLAAPSFCQFVMVVVSL